MVKFFTKSDFKMAITCPARLYYAVNNQYVNSNLEDSFLANLAEGGFQVGALAKCYFPSGIFIEEKDNELALIKTAQLLNQDNVILFEAAVKHQNLFVRVDILIKQGSILKLIEVKAKSYSKEADDNFLNKKGSKIATKWKPYIYDVAFQNYVLQNAFPEMIVKSYLMLADKDVPASVSGLNQKFILQRKENETLVKIVGDITPDALGDKILVQVPADQAIKMIWDGRDELLSADKELDEWIEYFADNYLNNRKMTPVIEAANCSKCEFKATLDQERDGLLSGFKECWQQGFGLKDEDLDKPNILEVWNFRGKQTLLEAGKIFLDQIDKEDIEVKESDGIGLTSTDRQWLQIEKCQNNDNTFYFDKPGFTNEARSWNWPFHFIDFETSAVAIPFNKGRRPYEGIAFQFSHHVMHKNGEIEHVDEYINKDIGKFPNFEFIRRLKESLEKDGGSIFRYSTHENTYLNHIYEQLNFSKEGDRDELCLWIKSITKSKKGSNEKWTGKRNMIDMCELVKKYYYNPQTKGSNSLKYLLPAVLNSSAYLQNKYSRKIYGSPDGIRSLNFKQHQWIEKDDQGNVINPYELLPDLFEGIDQDSLDQFMIDSNLADGGAAMTAYAKLQFTQLSSLERSLVINGLLKYCELDTFAMVMIMEEWLHLLSK